MIEQEPSRLELENASLRARLEEAESILQAIRGGKVDAFLVDQGSHDQVLVLDGVDRPYRLLIEQMNQAAVTISEDGTIIFVNRRLTELLRRDAHELVGKEMSAYVVPADREKVSAVIQMGQRGNAEAEVQLSSADGAVSDVHLAISPLMASIGVLCVIITDLRERNRLSAEHAARMAAESTALALREEHRRKDEFLAMLAHELRGPLAPIRNAVEMLVIRDLPWGMREQLHGLMSRQVESLVRLVDDLLDASRVTQGKIRLQPERVDLRDVVARSVESARVLIKERHHRFAFERGDDEIPVDVDVVRMAQVVHNLLSNAAKFTPPGGTVALRVTHTTDTATVEVHDTGIGIPPEAFPVVFELFAQVDPSVGRAEGGLGVGLTLARRLVEMHGGQLTGCSEGPGHGTTFTITLPMATGNAPVRRIDHAIPEISPPRRVLIVDDNQDAAESLAMLLRLKGHHVETFADGEGALEGIRAANPHLVLLDLGLPGMDGFEVARRIRAELGEAAPRIVALSGYGNDADRQRSTAAGFHRHLVKPVHPDVVTEILATLHAPH